MRQKSFTAEDFEKYRKKTRKEVVLEEMDQIVPWQEMSEAVKPHYPAPKGAGNGIIALSMRALPRLKARVNLTPVEIVNALTFDLSNLPFGQFINLVITILPSSTGLEIDNVSVGSINFSGRLAISFTEFVLNQVVSGDNFGTELVNAIDSIEVDNSRLTLVYHSIPGFRDAFKDSKEHIKQLRDDLALLGDPKLTRLYYEHICKFHAHIGESVQVSVGYYLSTAFAFAAKRTYISEEPVEENKTALMALAIFLGNSQFDSFVGALDKETLNDCQPRNSKMVLANRRDLRLHFIYSAALKVLSDSELSFALGEFKELLDSQQGGSGFSFADLAADRAGIRFAELALDKNGAHHVQGMASELKQEEPFFPSLAELPEGLSQLEFDEGGGIEGKYYKRHLAMINQRIADLALYRIH